MSAQNYHNIAGVINMPAGVNPIPKWILTLSGGMGVAGIVAMIVLFILLHKYGII